MKNVISGVQTQFSYESIGLLRLNSVLFLVLAAMLYQLVADYRRQYRRTERWMSPHPIMIISSGLQVFSVFLTCLNLWIFSGNGEGFLACDIISRIFDALSETTMSLLLI